MKQKSIGEIIEKIKNLGLPQKFDLVVAIGRNGIIPACLVNQILDIPLEIIHLNYRDKNHQVCREEPCLMCPTNLNCQNQAVLLIDDVSKTGKTLEKAKILLGKPRLVKTLVVNGKADYALYDEECFKMPWLI